MIEGVFLGIIAGVLIAMVVVGLAKREAGKRQATVEEEPKFESREFDPNNPPKVMIYRPRPDRPALMCTNPGCYRPLEGGEKVLIWPVKHAHGSYDIYCSNCVAMGKR